MGDLGLISRHSLVPEGEGPGVHTVSMGEPGLISCQSLVPKGEGPGAPTHWAARRLCLVRRGIERELIVLFVGALHRYIVEEQRGREHSLRHVAKVVGNKKVFSRGHNVGAQGSLIQIVERRATHQFTLAGGVPSGVTR